MDKDIGGGVIEAERPATARRRTTRAKAEAIPTAAISAPPTPRPDSPAILVPGLDARLPLPGADLAWHAWEYLLDSAQRSLLFWDVLRKRGNQYMDHRRKGSPPVLTFDYEVVLDGRSFERPVNYQLVRIIPDPGMTIDDARRPYVVVDPRAGHGPGIGGSKKDSQIGVALRAGHPVYFVMFFPEPMPGQTIPDISRAEARFMAEIARRHPGAGKPMVIGNCQAGWAVAMMGAAHPDAVGPIVINGAPMSYWAGREGRNPMRYTGGLLGGAWLASLMGDLGDGKFDGAHLVANFENLNPANTLWSKQYNLYAKVDSEEPRYLEFEKWWGGFYLMNKEEIAFIVQNLFVGNKLEQGAVKFEDGTTLDLRNIRSPIVVFCSDGDNITPPQQALNWVVDLYDSDEAVKLAGQTIIYLVHKDIGHLGIFVSGKVAQREHTEIVGVMDYIEMLPPGLFEMVIEDYDPEVAEVDPHASKHVVRFEERRIADILALDDGREDEEDFKSVAAVSQINEEIYDRFGSPVVRSLSNPMLAEVLRETHPLRFQRTTVSDLNPVFWPVAALAEMARSFRRPASSENPFLRLEQRASGLIEEALNTYRDTRDSLMEQAFKAVYGPMGLETLLAAVIGAAQEDPGHPVRRSSAKEVEKAKAALMAKTEQGGFTEALVRIIAAVLLADGAADRREFIASATILKNTRQLQHLSMADYHRLFTEQSFIVQIDEDRALRTLTAMLKTPQERLDALLVAETVALADLDLSEAETAVLNKIKAALPV